MDIEKVKQFYNNRIDNTKQLHSKTKQQIHLLGTIRLAIVLLAAISAYLLWDKSNWIVAGIIVLSIVLFLILMVKHNKLFQEKKYLESSISSDNNELKAIDYDFSAFDGAEEKINGEHHFSLDLDIFGKKSLFQSINRTSTVYGKILLADWFQKPLKSKAEILSRQEATKELAQNTTFTHRFRVTGLLNPGKASDLNEIKDFVNQPSSFLKSNYWKVMVYLVPCIWVALISLVGFNIVPAPFLPIAIIAGLILSESQYQKVNTLQNLVGKKVSIFSSYADSIKIIENENLQSALLVNIKKQLTNEGRKASTSIKKLSKLLADLDIRFNMPARFMMNTLFLWDIRKSIEIERWKESHNDVLEPWIKALGECDALCSLGSFSFNHPDYVFPEITENYFELKAKALGHPLLHRDVCVKNDIDISLNPYFMIVTGANMAGKSTYLRTVGINYLLACIGIPVCADSMSVYPATLVTSLRTSDSLSDNESYFFAELKRLKMIIDELNSGEEMFIILDEILKGTNSVDKQKGSLALIQQFVSLKSCGIIATHDLLLGKLEEEFPDKVKNFRFEADITNNELTFSYKLRTGIAQNMNACFLMKKMGITV